MDMQKVLGLLGIHIHEIVEADGQLLVKACTTTRRGICPRCGTRSERVHSYYWRSIQDLSVQASRVRLKLRVKRWRCVNAECAGVTFAERLPEIVGWHQQRTVRLTRIVTEIGLILGGTTASRVLALFALGMSRQTVLRLIRRSCLLPSRPRWIGVDDWCWRRGVRYGTLIVDLETHRPVDLLPDREADTLADWLAQHPQLEIVSRDRARPYAEGIRRGAPQARQVADRWHLLKNLGERLRHTFEHYAKLLRQVVVEPTPVPQVSAAFAAVLAMPSPPLLRPPRPEVQARLDRRAAWEAIFQQVQALLATGMSVTAVARQLGIDRSTVGKYRQLTTLPVKTCTRLGPRLLDPFRAYLRQRVLEANPVAPLLLKDIQAMGFTGHKGLVSTYLRELRAELGLNGYACRTPATLTQPAKTLTPQLLVLLVMRPSAQRTATQNRCIQQAPQCHPHLDRSIQLTLDFAQALRERNAAILEQWITQAAQSGLRAFKTFARSIQGDTAVQSAFSLPFSNGMVEGHINRLKLLKRQMYGRANFDLLRARVLYPQHQT